MVRLVLFDIDGTLIRTGGAGVGAFGQTAELLFGVKGASERTHFHGRTDTAIIREFLLQNGKGARHWDIRHFLDAYTFLLDHRMQEHPGEVCPGVLEFIEDLTRTKQPPVLGLLTGNIRLGAELKLRPHGLWDPWVLGAFGDDHEDRNQLARIALDRGSRHFGRRLKGDEVLVIGDTVLDVACARAIEARCLAVATGGGSPEMLKESGATWVAETLEDIRAMEVCQ